ncbi:MAG: hypothetical protein K2X00_09155 [Nitrospiraceae bacterium]|nr:hypothetical protein [Nitrospiraceae bacterium]
MSRKERAFLGFGDELETFDPATWSEPNAAVSQAKPKPAEARRAAEAADFRSREAAPKPPQRRRRTGRNVQFNIKTRQDAIDAFARIADATGWGFGAAFERATELLEREHAAGRL